MFIFIYSSMNMHIKPIKVFIISKCSLDLTFFHYKYILPVGFIPTGILFLYYFKQLNNIDNLYFSNSNIKNVKILPNLEFDSTDKIILHMTPIAKMFINNIQDTKDQFNYFANDQIYILRGKYRINCPLKHGQKGGIRFSNIGNLIQCNNELFL